MTDNAAKTPRKKSQKRQRDKQIKTPLTKNEFNRVSARAAAMGLSYAAFSRLKMLDETGERSQTRPHPDAQLIRKALALHGRYGNNMNQVAHNLNAYGVRGLEADFKGALKEWAAIRDMMLAALGHHPDNGPAPQGA